MTQPLIESPHPAVAKIRTGDPEIAPDGRYDDYAPMSEDEIGEIKDELKAYKEQFNALREESEAFDRTQHPSEEFHHCLFDPNQ